jgi:hypothetical protein
MDISRSFSYPTEDQDWLTKVALGGLLSWIPIVGQFYLYGYALETLQNIIAGREVPLPEVVEDFGGKLLKGLMIAVINFIYALPLIVIIGGAQAANFAPLMAENASEEAFTAITTVLTIVSVCFGCLALIYGILMSLVIPFAWSKYAESEQFSDAFKLGEIWELLKNNIGPAFIVTVISGLAGFIALLAGSLLCGVGLIVTMFYAQLIIAFLYGSLYRQAKASVL